MKSLSIGLEGRSVLWEPFTLIWKADGAVVGGGGQWNRPSVGLEGRGTLSHKNSLCSFRADGTVVGVDGQQSPCMLWHSFRGQGCAMRTPRARALVWRVEGWWRMMKTPHACLEMWGCEDPLWVWWTEEVMVMKSPGTQLESRWHGGRCGWTLKSPQLV